METPIPNFYFMGVQFVHLLALSIWVGGIVVIRSVVESSLFQGISSRQAAVLLMGEILKKFNRATLLCAVALLATGVIKFLNWENLTPWNSIRYLAILVMSLISVYVAFKLVPRMDQVHSRQNASLDVTKLGLPNLNRLNEVSDRLMMVNLICGVTALLMA